MSQFSQEKNGDENIHLLKLKLRPEGIIHARVHTCSNIHTETCAHTHTYLDTTNAAVDVVNA